MSCCSSVFFGTNRMFRCCTVVQIASASSFLSRRLLSSSAFSRFASETSSPPYFAFHLMGWTAPLHRWPKWRKNAIAREVTHEGSGNRH